MSETNWKNRAKELDELWQPNEELSEYRRDMLTLIVEEMGVNPYLQLLDCGCGSGLVFKNLPPELKFRYSGIDFTEDMIEYCKKQNPEHSYRFRRIDLTTPFLALKGDLLITQNVLQHILLFQTALDNIFNSASYGVIFCERTHKGQTLIAGYEPAVRWRFNIRDMVEILKYFKQKYNYKGQVEILGHPKTTFNEENMLTIFRVYRRFEKISENKLSDFEYNRLIFCKPRKPKTRTERIKNFILSYFQ